MMNDNDWHMAYTLSTHRNTVSIPSSYPFNQSSLHSSSHFFSSDFFLLIYPVKPPIYSSTHAFPDAAVDEREREEGRVAVAKSAVSNFPGHILQVQDKLETYEAIVNTITHIIEVGNTLPLPPPLFTSGSGVFLCCLSTSLFSYSRTHHIHHIHIAQINAITTSCNTYPYFRQYPPLLHH